MKKRFFKVISLLLLIIFLFTSFTFAEQSTWNKEKDFILSRMIFQTLEYWHYRPADLNDSFSSKVFTEYLKNLDPNQRFFTEQDIHRLKQYQYQIDNQIINGSTTYMELANSILEERIHNVQHFLPELLEHPFNLTTSDTLQTDPVKRGYSRDQAELKQLWRKMLKARVIETYVELLKTKSKGKLPLRTKVNPQLEAQARHKVERMVKSSLTRLLRETDEEKSVLYLNSILACYDPHTTYFPPQQREEFDISMSGTFEGIGAVLTTDGEYVKVEQIIPGSTAWRQKELKAGDLILKVGEGKREPVDIANMPLSDVVKLIRGKKGTEVRLTVRKPDGTQKVILIKRDTVVIEESYARSAVVINPKNHKKIGYISLPSFYRDYNSKNARSSAADVRKELLKLNKQKIAGIILDLRNNSGGSLEDAVDMTGLFIKDGPVIQTKNNTGKIEIFKDNDPTIVSDVPMVVLVNTLSASASEILSAALQDYGRAVIVGSPNTFGKGSVQTLLDLDTLLPSNYSKYKPVGSLKLTTQKYYRITGGSVQFRGVQSDIVLPDPYSNLKIGEAHLDYALPWDTIKSTHYQKWNHLKINLAELQHRSALRLKSNQAFQLVNASIAQVKKESSNTVETLNLLEALKQQNKANRQSDALASAQKKGSHLKVTSMLPKNRQTNDWLKQLSNDIYVEEASNILSDMINQK